MRNSDRSAAAGADGADAASAASLQSELRERDDILRLAEESAGIAVWDIDMATRTVRATPQFFRIRGIAPADAPVPVATLRGLRHPDDRQQATEDFERAVAGGHERFETEYRIIRPDGQVRWIFGRGKVVRDASGKPVRCSGIDIDVTDRRQVEEALRESEERYRTLVESANDLVMSLDLDFRITAANRAVERVLGYPPEEIIGTSLGQHIPPEQLGMHRAMLQQKLEGAVDTRYEMRVMDKAGRVRILETASRLSHDRAGRPVAIHAIARDVTEARTAQQALRDNEERLRLASRVAALGMYEIDWVSGQRYWSPELRALLKVPDDVPVNNALVERMLPPRQVARYRERLLMSLLPDGDGEYEDEHRVTRYDGTPGWILLRGKTFFADSPSGRRAVRSIGLAIDITERKRAEEANALLASVVQSSSDAIISAAPDGTIRSWNLGAERLYGFGAEELIGRPLSVLAPPERSSEMQDLLRRTARGERVFAETLRRHRDGQLLPVEISGSPMLTGDGEIVGISAIHRDIAERKRYEEHIALTMRELSHRTKNLFAVVQAMAREIGRRSGSFAEFEARFFGCVQALAHCHDLLVEHEWEGAGLDELVRLQLAPFGGVDGRRFLTAGPPLILKPQAMQLVGLALHELATNAAKHGALTLPTGAVSIEWAAPAPEDGIRLTWKESGGPLVQPPERRGFGHTVLERMAATLGSEAALEFPPDGVCWRLTLKPDHIVGRARPPAI